jgi:predicted ATPase
MPRLAVLIGPNGGGKSNFIDLLALMAEAGNGQLANGVSKRGGFPNIAFGFDPSREVRIELRFKEALSWRVPTRGGDDKLDVRFKMAARNYAFGAQVIEELVRQESLTEPSLSADIVSRGPAGAVFRPAIDLGVLTTPERRGVAFTELVISQVKDSIKYPAASAVLNELAGWAFYRDIDVGPEARVRQPALIRPDVLLVADGSNLSSVLYSIQQSHPDLWSELLEDLHTAYPDFVKLTVPAGGGDGKVHLRWFERPYEKEGMSANLLSDGTLKLLCLIAVLKSPDPPLLTCIDEPELGLHPDWIELVAELLQDAATRTQVIVATHSPQIVAKLEPEQVIVTEKVEGETHLTQLKTADLENWLKDFSLAELWLSGEIGGRP